jgi:sugar diacid utilization regulator
MVLFFVTASFWLASCGSVTSFDASVEQRVEDAEDLANRFHDVQFADVVSSETVAKPSKKASVERILSKKHIIHLKKQQKKEKQKKKEKQQKKKSDKTKNAIAAVKKKATCVGKKCQKKIATAKLKAKHAKMQAAKADSKVKKIKAPAGKSHKKMATAAAKKAKQLLKAATKTNDTKKKGKAPTRGETASEALQSRIKESKGKESAVNISSKT